MITRELFGLCEGREVYKYRLCAGEYEAELCDYGCRIVSFSHIKNGRRLDAALGYDSLESYLKPCGNMGAVCGRFANRIAGGRFSIDSREYSIAVNNGPNHLHGGLRGFDRRVWSSSICGESVCMDYLSPDGEEGYPGNLAVSVRYALSENGELSVDYSAETDRPTVLNLTNHSYFNLSGDFSKSVDGHIASVFAESYLVSDGDCLPTGEVRGVAGTVFDLREGRGLGEVLHSGEAEIDVARGLDHCYAINGYDGRSLNKAAEVFCPESGARLICLTTAPGLQLYTANWLEGTPRLKGGTEPQNHCAFCLEAQSFPASPNYPHFPNTVLRRGETYSRKTVYALSVEA